MSSITLNVADIFPVGTSVAAYPRSNWSGDSRPSGTPVGSSAATATVASDGTLTFPSLTDGVVYEAYAQVSGQDRYRRFMPSSAPSAGSGSVILTASPWTAGAGETAGDVVSEGDALYTVPTSRTAAGAFSAGDYDLGALDEASVYEQDSLGQVIAIWKGNGTGNAATKLLDVAGGDGSILRRQLEGLARPNAGWMIGNGFAQNGRRDNYPSTVTPTTRQIVSAGGLILPGGKTVSALRLIATASLAAAVHQFVAFYDARTLALLAAGTDVTSQAWAVSGSATDQSFPISYTPAASLEVLVAYYVEATTPPVLAAEGSTSAMTLAPRMGGKHDTLPAGSGPGALPATLGAAVGSAGPFWVQAE